MNPSQVSNRGLSTHVAITVEPAPPRPVVLKAEFDDDGSQSPGYTLARVILAAYPSAIIELLLLDLIQSVVTSSQSDESRGFIDGDVPGVAGLRKRLDQLASYWDVNRTRVYGAHPCYDGRPAE